MTNTATPARVNDVLTAASGHSEPGWPALVIFGIVAVLAVAVLLAQRTDPDRHTRGLAGRRRRRREAASMSERDTTAERDTTGERDPTAASDTTDERDTTAPTNGDNATARSVADHPTTSASRGSVGDRSPTPPASPRSATSPKNGNSDPDEQPPRTP